MRGTDEQQAHQRHGRPRRPPDQGGGDGHHGAAGREDKPPLQYANSYWDDEATTAGTAQSTTELTVRATDKTMGLVVRTNIATSVKAELGRKESDVHYRY